jgi:cytosine permease
VDQKKQISSTLEDYSLRPVPLSERKSWISLTIVWIGIAVVMSAIFRGMMIGLGLGHITSIVLSYVLGEILLVGIMALSGYIGARTGLSTPLIANLSFGRIGSVLISLSIALSLLGWFGVQAAFFARTIQYFFNSDFSLPLFSFACGIIMMIPAIFGIRGLSALSWIASPFVLAVFIIGLIKSGFDFLPLQTLTTLAQNHQPDPYPLTVGAAASVVAGGFIVGATTSADIFRYSRPRFKNILGAATAAMVVSAFLHLAGSVFAMNTGLYHENLPELIISSDYLGLGFIGFLVLLLAQWTTNDSNIYSSVLALNNIFKTKRWLVTIGAGIFASMLAALGILERLELFLIFLTVSIGPIGGIFICDYYLLKRFKATELAKNNPHPANIKALGVYLVSVILGWVTSGHPFIIQIFPFSIFAFNGIISSIILYYVIMKIFPEKENKNGSQTGHRNS